MVMTCCRRPRAQPRPGGGPAADRLLPRPRPGAAAARARGLHRQPRPHQPRLLRGQPLRWYDMTWHGVTWHDMMIWWRWHDTCLPEQCTAASPGWAAPVVSTWRPPPTSRRTGEHSRHVLGQRRSCFYLHQGHNFQGEFLEIRSIIAKMEQKCHSFIMCKLAPGNKGAGTPLATAPSIDNMLTMPTYCDSLPRCVQVFLLFSRHRNKSNKKLL